MTKLELATRAAVCLDYIDMDYLTGRLSPEDACIALDVLEKWIDYQEKHLDKPPID